MSIVIFTESEHKTLTEDNINPLKIYWFLVSDISNNSLEKLTPPNREKDLKKKTFGFLNFLFGQIETRDL